MREKATSGRETDHRVWADLLHSLILHILTLIFQSVVFLEKEIKVSCILGVSFFICPGLLQYRKCRVQCKTLKDFVGWCARVRVCMRVRHGRFAKAELAATAASE